MSKFSKGDFVSMNGRPHEIFVVIGALSDSIEIVRVTDPAGSVFLNEPTDCYSLLPLGKKVEVGNVQFSPGKVVSSNAGQTGFVCQGSTTVFVTSGKDQWSCQPLGNRNWWPV